MTHLRKRMLEELQRRNNSEGTTRAYLQAVQQFAVHFGKSPDKLGPDDLRSYQAYLLVERKLAVASVVKKVHDYSAKVVANIASQRLRNGEIGKKGAELFVCTNARPRTAEYSDLLSVPRRDTSAVRFAGSAVPLKFRLTSFSPNASAEIE